MSPQTASITGMKKAQAEAENARKELEEFKKRVVETTNNWPSGCESGKLEFLMDLGLAEIPTGTYEVVLRFEVHEENYAYVRDELLLEDYDNDIVTAAKIYLENTYNLDSFASEVGWWVISTKKVEVE